MPKEILIDSGPLIALFHGNDKFHKPVLGFLQESNYLLATTWPVITEVCYFLYRGTKSLLNFLEWIERGGLKVYDLSISDIQVIKNRIQKYSDVPMDMADASIVFIAERESILEIFSIDSDFQIYKLSNGKFLKNLFVFPGGRYKKYSGKVSS